MDFRKAFFATQEEIEAQQRLLEEINRNGIQGYIDKGLSESDAKKAWDEHLHFWYSNEARGYYG